MPIALEQASSSSSDIASRLNSFRGNFTGLCFTWRSHDGTADFEPAPPFPAWATCWRPSVPTATLIPPEDLASGFSDRLTVDRKSTRLNSSHSQISYAVFCLKKKK